jgi:hypothetical protein
MTMQRTLAAAAKGVITLAALVCAALAVSAPAAAQAAANPADLLAPAERETFTFTFRSTALPDTSVWTLTESPALELSAGEKWRFTFNLDSQNPERLEFDSVRAGAFFDVTPRMRLGGALSFSDESNAITRASGGSLNEDVPQVKFESAFRF